jgi:uncharacterized membrane protein
VNLGETTRGKRHVIIPHPRAVSRATLSLSLSLSLSLCLSVSVSLVPTRVLSILRELMRRTMYMSDGRNREIKRERERERERERQ